MIKCIFKVAYLVGLSSMYTIHCSISYEYNFVSNQVIYIKGRQCYKIYKITKPYLIRRNDRLATEQIRKDRMGALVG